MRRVAEFLGPGVDSQGLHKALLRPDQGLRKALLRPRLSTPGPFLALDIDALPYVLDVPTNKALEIKVPTYFLKNALP